MIMMEAPGRETFQDICLMKCSYKISRISVKVSEKTQHRDTVYAVPLFVLHANKVMEFIYLMRGATLKQM
jgi:hypothetical protein